VDLRLGGSFDPPHRNPAINDAVVVANDRGGRHRPAIHLGRLLRGQGMSIQVLVAEVVDINKCKGLDAQAEAE
jgi:hypothetical protein